MPFRFLAHVNFVFIDTLYRTPPSLQRLCFFRVGTGTNGCASGANGEIMLPKLAVAFFSEILFPSRIFFYSKFSLAWRDAVFVAFDVWPRFARGFFIFYFLFYCCLALLFYFILSSVFSWVVFVVLLVTPRLDGVFSFWSAHRYSSSGPSLVLVCASQQYERHSGNRQHSAHYLTDEQPSVPSDSRGTVYSEQPALLDRHCRRAVSALLDCFFFHENLLWMESCSDPFFYFALDGEMDRAPRRA